MSNRPFADYFWIAGLDSQDLIEAYRSQTSSLDLLAADDGSTDQRRSVPVQEDTVKEEETSSDEPPASSPSTSRPNSYDRLSRLSDEARRSIQSINGIVRLNSNRSSATIRPAQTPTLSSAVSPSPAISDAAFESAIKKFTSDRDTFLNLDFKNENVSKSSPSKPRPKTLRIMPEDLDAGPTRSLGSVRRHVSFREMSSTRRQPSMARRGKLWSYYQAV